MQQGDPSFALDIYEAAKAPGWCLSGPCAEPGTADVAVLYRVSNNRIDQVLPAGTTLTRTTNNHTHNQTHNSTTPVVASIQIWVGEDSGLAADKEATENTLLVSAVGRQVSVEADAPGFVLLHPAPQSYPPPPNTQGP